MIVDLNIMNRDTKRSKEVIKDIKFIDLESISLLAKDDTIIFNSVGYKYINKTVIYVDMANVRDVKQQRIYSICLNVFDVV